MCALVTGVQTCALPIWPTEAVRRGVMVEDAKGALSGKVAVVTGGARNIGRAVVIALAGEGAAVVVNAHSDGAAAEAVADEVRAGGGRAIAQIADVTDEVDRKSTRLNSSH